MTDKKSQEEMEQPAKQWQVAAVEGKVDELKELMRAFGVKVDGLITRTDDTITNQQFEIRATALTTAWDLRLKDEVDKIHLEYRPGKKRSEWLFKVIIVEAIAIVGQVIALGILARG